MKQCRSLALAVAFLGVGAMTMAGAADIRAYDVGPSDSGVWPGFQALSDAPYSKDAGVGWSTKAKLALFKQRSAHPGFVGGLQDPLVVDGVSARTSHRAELKIDLPSGRYAVWMLTSFYRTSYCNSLWGSHWIAAEDKTVWRLDVDKKKFFDIYYHGMNRDYGNALRRDGVWKTYLKPWLDDWKQFETEVKDGQLDLALNLVQDRLHALVIAPVASAEEAERLIARASRDRETWFNDRWKEEIPEQEGTPAPVTAEDRARGYVLFGKPWMAEVHPRVKPMPEELNPTLKILATPGEREPAAICVRSLKDLKTIQVTVGDLAGPNGATIPASAFEQWIVRYETRPYPGGTYRIIPVTLEKRPPIDLDRDITKMYFLKVLVPEKAAPGVYVGAVRFKPANAPASHIPLKVRVLPFRLEYPRDTSFTVELSSVARYMRPGMDDPDIEAQFWDWVRKYLRNYREHNMTSIRSTWMPASKVEGDKVTIDFTGGKHPYYNIDRLMEIYREEGFTGPQVMDQGFMGLICWGLRMHPSRTKLAVYSEPRTVKLIMDAVRQYRDHVKAKGWPEFVLYAIGEPTNFDNGVEKAIAIFKAIKKVPGARTAMSSISERDHAAFPWVDVVLFGSPSQNNMGEKMRAAGKDLWGYNCGVSRLSYGFFVWRSHMKGRTQEHFQSTLQDRPFNDFLGTSSCWSYTHVAFGPEGVRPCPRLEHEAEGVDDYRYLITLEKRIADARKKGGPAAERAARAEALLNRIRDNVPDDMRIFYREGGEWDPGIYDRLRSRIAQEILALQGLL